MANTYTAAFYAALEKFVPSLTAKSRLVDKVTNYGAVNASSIKIPKPAAPTAVAKTSGTAITYADNVLTSATLTLDQHYVVPLYVEDAEQQQAPEMIAQACIPDAVEKLLNKMDSTLAALQSDLTGDNRVGTLGVPLTLEVVRTAKRVLEVANATPEFLAIDPRIEELLYTDDDFVKIYSPQLAGAYVSGQLPQIAGFSTVVNNNLYSPATGQVVGLAWMRSAFGIAFGDLGKQEQGAGRIVTRYQNGTGVNGNGTGITIYITQTATTDGLGQRYAIHAKWGVVTVDATRAVAVLTGYGA
jgi:hypothetical protein